MPLPPVAPAVAAIVAASPREKALATLKAITPGVIQRRSDQELRWQHESLLKTYEHAGNLRPPQFDQPGEASGVAHDVDIVARD
jgi:hypothetical protein